MIFPTIFVKPFFFHLSPQNEPGFLPHTLGEGVQFNSPFRTTFTLTFTLL
jgi:hypothetical protein